MDRRTFLATGLAGLVLPTFASAQPMGQPMIRRMRPPSPPPSLRGDGADVPGAPTSGGALTAPVIIGGRTFKFLIDTGAAGHGRITASAARGLNLPVVSRVLMGEPSGQNPREASVFGCHALAVGGVTFGGLTLGELPPLGPRVADIDGILGYDLFQSLILRLDYPSARVRMRRGELPASDDRTVFATGENAAPRLTVVIGDVALPCDLDTGQQVAPLIVPASLAASLPTRGEPRPLAAARTASQVVQMQAVTLAASVRVGGFTLPVTEAGYPSLLPDLGNLGCKALTGIVLDVDRSHHRVALRRA